VEKTARRKMQDARGEAKEEFNAAVVQTISDSQKDLGVKTESFEAVNPEKLLPGARLRVRGFNKPVIFRRLDGSTAEIEAGPLRMKVAVDEITAIEAEPAGKLASAGKRGDITVTSAPGEGSSSGEINVIGMTVEEATQRVDKFLDEAILANRARVRIIHGHGTGALRRGLAEFLKTHPLVASVAFEAEEHGGKAITVVDLRA
jgi:DNA mismatch repair protein MutS2